jgi:hypothetical protein
MLLEYEKRNILNRKNIGVTIFIFELSALEFDFFVKFKGRLFTMKRNNTVFLHIFMKLTFVLVNMQNFKNKFRVESFFPRLLLTCAFFLNIGLFNEFKIPFFSLKNKTKQKRYKHLHVIMYCGQH